MDSAIINVRHEFGNPDKYIRIARAADANVHRAFQRDVLLYHPRDVKPSGFYAVGRLIDFCPDYDNDQFMYVAVSDIRPLPEPVTARQYLKATKQNVPDDWIYRKFAPGFQLVPVADLRIIEQLGGLQPGVSERSGSAFMPLDTSNSFDSKWFADPITREARQARDAQLRYEALNQYGPACSVTDITIAAPGGLAYEVEVCHLWAFGEGGPDNINNVLPTIRTIHWCLDKGWFGIRRAGHIVLAPGAQQTLLTLLTGRTRVRFPTIYSKWPHPDCLQWHWENRFRRALELLKA
ncbi:MAG: hypothetical protein EOP84_36305, partial [Verrucomicrobiaceae bacterium]